MSCNLPHRMHAIARSTIWYVAADFQLSNSFTSVTSRLYQWGLKMRMATKHVNLNSITMIAHNIPFAMHAQSRVVHGVKAHHQEGAASLLWTLYVERTYRKIKLLASLGRARAQKKYRVKGPRKKSKQFQFHSSKKLLNTTSIPIFENTSMIYLVYFHRKIIPSPPPSSHHHH